MLVLRTFSKIFGLAGLRIGYGIGPLDVVAAIDKVRRPFDLTSAGQEMALASLGDDREIARRRASAAAGRTIVADALAYAGFAVVEPPAANFVYADVGEDANRVFDALLREGVIVRPLHGFGAPTAIRVTVGTAEENALLARRAQPHDDRRRLKPLRSPEWGREAAARAVTLSRAWPRSLGRWSPTSRSCAGGAAFACSSSPPSPPGSGRSWRWSRSPSTSTSAPTPACG